MTVHPAGGLQLRAEETRGKLLRAAEQAFNSRGYDGTSVADICEAAGVSKGAFYHHFPSKENIFLELLDRWLGGLDAQLQSLATDSGEFPEMLTQLASFGKQIRTLAGNQYTILLEFWTKARLDPAIWKVTISYFQRYRQYFAKLIEDAIAKGVIRPIPVPIGAQLLLSIALGLLLQSMLDPEGAPWDEVTNQVMVLLLESLAVLGPTGKEA